MTQSSSINERAVEPFLVASRSRNTSKLLKLLFIPSPTLQASPEIPELLILPEVKGDLSENYDLVKELIKSSAEHKLERVSLPLIEYLRKTLIEATMLVYSSIRKGEHIDEAEVTTKIVSMTRAKFKEYERALPELVSKVFIPLIQSSMGWISTMLMDYILKKWNYIKWLEPDYEKMLDIMKRIGILRPFLQVMVCPHCLSTSLIVSESLTEVSICPKCGRKPLVGILYLLNEDLAKLKSMHEDIVHFIASYLKYKSFEEFPLSLPSIRIKYVSNKGAEIDVYIEELRYGIECKIYDVVEEISSKHIENWLRDLRSKIEGYNSSDVKYMLIVTNLRGDFPHILKRELTNYINEKGLSINLEDVLGADPEKLIEKLNEIAKRAANQMQENMKKEVEAKTKVQGIT